MKRSVAILLLSILFLTSCGPASSSETASDSPAVYIENKGGQSSMVYCLSVNAMNKIIIENLSLQYSDDYAAFFLQGELIEYGEGKSLLTAPRQKRTEDYVTGRFG